MRFPFRAAALLSLPVAIAVASYFLYVPAHPPGFSLDESSICYNAYTIAQTGHDEYGIAWPLFFRAFGEYKNPTLIYLLAILFRVTGPSIAVARTLTAGLGAISGLLLGLLARKITKDWITAAIVAITALLTPWLFESSRLVFEVALYPALLALLLLTLWQASVKQQWTWREVLVLAAELALLTYSYSIGRLLAPLLALGLVLFVNRKRWRGVIGTWLLYAIFLVPLFVFHREHPGALTGRFKALTYLDSNTSIWTQAEEFGAHYLANVNPSRWLISGEDNIRDHVHGTGSLLAVSVVLAAIGFAIVLKRHRGDPRWRFLVYSVAVSPVPASLTSNPFPQLRLIAFPMFLLPFVIPALEWLMAARARKALLVLVVVFVVAQGAFFQWRYHKGAPSLWYVFDARFPRKVLAPALAAGPRPIALIDEPGKSGYIQTLWHGLLAAIPSGEFVRLTAGASPFPGAVVISTAEECHDCRLVARALNYIVYSVPPYPEDAAASKTTLSDYRAEIVCENPPGTIRAGEKIILRFLIKNISSAEWSSVGKRDGDGAVVLRSRWHDSRDTVVVDPDVEQHVTYDIEPGDTLGLAMPVTAPSKAGDYWLEVDLVEKGVGWFSERGSALWRRKVQVVLSN